MIRSRVAQKGVLMVSVNNNIIHVYNDMAIFLCDFEFSLADLCQIFISHRKGEKQQHSIRFSINNFVDVGIAVEIVS